jgi:hypothetical protein
LASLQVVQFGGLNRAMIEGLQNLTSGCLDVRTYRDMVPISIDYLIARRTGN